MFILRVYQNNIFKNKNYILYSQEFDKKAEQWHRQVVLKELQSSVSLNDEIQKLFSNDSSSRETISQQRRLERKISNN